MSAPHPVNSAGAGIAEYSNALFPEVLALYRDAGWTNDAKQPELLKKAYRNSLRALCAFRGSSPAGAVPAARR
jgi:hypothetical protein